jgi:hypothetical protein
MPKADHGLVIRLETLPTPTRVGPVSVSFPLPASLRSSSTYQVSPVIAVWSFYPASALLDSLVPFAPYSFSTYQVSPVIYCVLDPRT